MYLCLHGLFDYSHYPYCSLECLFSGGVGDPSGGLQSFLRGPLVHALTLCHKMVFKIIYSSYARLALDQESAISVTALKC